MPIDFGGALGGIGSFAGNMISSAINSSRSWKYTQRAMALQDYYNRKYTHDQYGLMRSGLEEAGYNPLLALGSSASSAIYSGSGINSDSDNGSQAITSAIEGMRVRDEHKISEATKDKIDAETEGIKLENRQKNSEINTSPKTVISDLIEGKDNPVANKVREFLGNHGINIKPVTSAKSSQANVVIKLHDGKPFIQKGVPKSVVKSFNNSFSNSAVRSQNNQKELLGIWNSSRKVHGHIMSDNEVKNYRGSKRSYSKPPKSYPIGM